MTNKDNKSDPNDISAQEILDFLRGGDGVSTSTSTKEKKKIFFRQMFQLIIKM